MEVIWTPGMSLENLEKQVVKKAFAFYGKNKTATSNSLGIAIRTLDAKLEQYEKEDAKEQELKDELKTKEREYVKRARGQETGYEVNANLDLDKMRAQVARGAEPMYDKNGKPIKPVPPKK